MIELPPGKYFMVMWNIAQQFGGMTSMCMTRARNFLHYAGVNAPVLCFSLTGRFKALEASLKERGYLAAENQVLNVFEYYRAADLTNRPEVQAPDWRGRRPHDSEFRHERIIDEDDLVIADVYRADDNAIVYRECYRPDGSVYFVDQSHYNSEGARSKRRVWLIDQVGRPVGFYGGAGQFYYAWLDELVGDDRATFIFDDKSAATILRKYSRPNVLMITPIHSNHIKSAGDPERGVFDPNRLQIFTESWRWDALVFLTRSQRQDYIARFGEASNLPVIANPIEIPDRDESDEKRQTGRGVMVGRLASSKNIPSAIEAFRMAQEAVPNLSLDIYGEGDERSRIQEIIDSQGLSESVRLHGHVTGAAKEFGTAAFSLITSKFEGFALTGLESIARGCPVVAFNLRYGPPELIGDDEAGFIVPVNDVRAMANRIVDLTTDHELANGMADRGRERAEQYSSESITQKWAELIAELWEAKGAEPQIISVDASATAYRDSTGRVVVEAVLRWKSVGGRPISPSDIDARVRIVPERTGPAIANGLELNNVAADHCTARAALDLPGSLTTTDGDNNAHAIVEIVGAVRRVPFRSDILLPKRTRWEPAILDGKLTIVATQVDAL